MHGAHADDLASGAGDAFDDAAALELAHGFASAKKLSRQVDRNDPVPLVERHLVNRRVLLETGIRDQDVDGAPLLQHPRERRLDLVLLRDVAC
jgi:hypothetical protein